MEMSNRIIAYINITNSESELIDRVEVTEQEWDAPLPKSLIWMTIEQAVEDTRKYHMPEKKTNNV